MRKLNDIKGLIFDYGGTIDTNSRHWSEVLWEKYVEEHVPIGKDTFYEAYVYGERSLAKSRIVLPHHNFLDVLRFKVKYEMEYLAEQGKLPSDVQLLQGYVQDIANSCYQYVLDTLRTTLPIVKNLGEKYKMVLVSNFYGNLKTILEEFRLLPLFSDVIESSVVGVRKPDPAIFRLGVEAMGYRQENILVVGDSFSKDIVPAHEVGCRTAWLRGEGWVKDVIDESIPDIIFSDLTELPGLLAGKAAS